MSLPTSSSAAINPDAGHFQFGDNWRRFLESLNDDRIAAAIESLKKLLGVADLNGKTFLDAGCGSGLFSLAAARMGATVTSFDLDPNSVACAFELRGRFNASEARWTVLSGSLTDRPFLESLGGHDVVYCWGVAHHTGQMWTVIENLSARMNPDGLLVLAIYNDQQYVSRGWATVKKLYQKLPKPLRPLLVAGLGSVLFLKRLGVTVLASLLRLVLLRNPFTPFANWAREVQPRGMHVWHDLVDWVGGWPFEVARPEEVFRFLRDRGFTLKEMTTSGGHGCNEFVFINANGPAS